MEHSERRYPTPQYAEDMMRKIDNVSSLFRLVASQQQETLALLQELKARVDQDNASMRASLERLQDIVRRETGGAW